MLGIWWIGILHIGMDGQHELKMEYVCPCSRILVNTFRDKLEKRCWTGNEDEKAGFLHVI